MDVIQHIDIDLLQPGRYQPRSHFKEDALRALAETIRQSGMINPIVVRPLCGVPLSYEIVAGERRWRAAQLAQLQQVPAVVRECLSEREVMELAVLENVQREDLTPVEEARAIARLVEEFGLKHQEVADRLGRSRESVTNSLRLLTLPAQVIAWVDERTLSAGHAKVLAGLPEADQVRLAWEVIQRGWSVRALERRCKQDQRSRSPARPATRAGQDADLARLETALSELVGNVVRVACDHQGQGKLEIDFHSLDELDGLLSRLGYQSGDF